MNLNLLCFGAIYCFAVAVLKLAVCFNSEEFIQTAKTGLGKKKKKAFQMLHIE